eukprot:s116_g10.t2
MTGCNLLKSVCRGQAVVALSSGEAEYYAMLTSASQALGEQSIAREWDIKLNIHLWYDATAGAAMSSRRGLGKVKHIHTAFLWIQSYVTEGLIRLGKKHTSENLSDVLTKPVCFPVDTVLCDRRIDSSRQEAHVRESIRCLDETCLSGADGKDDGADGIQIQSWQIQHSFSSLAVWIVSAERIGTRLDEATDEFLKETKSCRALQIPPGQDQLTAMERGMPRGVSGFNSSSDADLSSNDSEDGGSGAAEMIQRAEAAMAGLEKGSAGPTSKGQEKLKKKKKKKTVQEAASSRNSTCLRQTRWIGKDGQIYLSQLPFSVTEEVLRKDFEKFGEVSRFFFHRSLDAWAWMGNASNKPAGTACLFYKDPAVADKVLLLDGIDYKGRAIRVRRRQPRKPSAGKQQAPQFKPRGAKRKAQAAQDRVKLAGKNLGHLRRLHAFVAYLGISLQLEPELSWVAREMLACPMPPQAEMKVSKAGVCYFHDLINDYYTIEHPLTQRYLKVLERQRLDLLCLRTKPSVNGLLFSQPDMLFNKQFRNLQIPCQSCGVMQSTLKCNQCLMSFCQSCADALHKNALGPRT